MAESQQGDSLPSPAASHLCARDDVRRCLTSTAAGNKVFGRLMHLGCTALGSESASSLQVQFILVQPLTFEYFYIVNIKLNFTVIFTACKVSEFF